MSGGIQHRGKSRQPPTTLSPCIDGLLLKNWIIRSSQFNGVQAG